MSDEGEELSLGDLHERNRPPETTPVAVRLPDPLLADLDAYWRERGYDTRSEFVREVLRYVADNPEEFGDLR
ncbi:MAG: CopG family ribbon-helix-helix protein [Halobacteriaceae archaeon]